MHSYNDLREKMVRASRCPRPFSEARRHAPGCKTDVESLPPLAAGGVLSHVKKNQKVLEVSETNRPTSLHNKKNQVRRHTCHSCRVAVFSADKFSNGVSRTPNK